MEPTLWNSAIYYDALQDTKAMVKSPDVDTESFWYNYWSPSRWHTSSLCFSSFIIFLDYVLRKVLDTNKELGLTLEKRKNRRYLEVKMTDVDYADDLAVLADTLVAH